MSARGKALAIAAVYLAAGAALHWRYHEASEARRVTSEMPVEWRACRARCAAESRDALEDTACIDMECNPLLSTEGEL